MIMPDPLDDGCESTVEETCEIWLVCSECKDGSDCNLAGVIGREPWPTWCPEGKRPRWLPEVL